MTVSYVLEKLKISEQIFGGVGMAEEEAGDQKRSPFYDLSQKRNSQKSDAVIEGNT